MKIELEEVKRSALLYSEGVNKSIKLREIDFVNYPKVISTDIQGYALQSADGKIQHSQWKFKGNKTMSKIEISSPFFKANQNLEVGDSFEIISEGEATPYPTKTDPNNKVWDFQLKKISDGTEKSCRLNTKILVALKEKLGDDMEKWLGTELLVKEINKMAKGFQIVWEIK